LPAWHASQVMLECMWSLVATMTGAATGNSYPAKANPVNIDLA